MTDKSITLVVELQEWEADALAMHLKRSGFKTYMDTAESESDAYDQLHAAEKVRHALTRAGFSPR